LTAPAAWTVFGGETISTAPSSSTTSCQTPRNFIDRVQGTICVHIGFAAPDKKLSFPLPPRFNYLFTFATPEYSGVATLHHYNKFTRHLGLRHYFVTTNILGYLVNFFSSA
jgi:hypothetical protein